VEGNHYFPPESLRREFFSKSETESLCAWKGTALYCTVTVDGQVNDDAGWYYPNPRPRARRIKDHVAFWKSVEIEGEAQGAGPTVADRIAGWLGKKK